MGAEHAAAPGGIARGRAAGWWPRLLAFGKRWPAAFRHAHSAALYLLPVELITGAILYFPRLHTSLIRLLPTVLAIHIWAGVLFGLLLLVPLLLPLGRRLAAILDWNATVWLTGGLTVTGLALWLGVAPVLRAGSFTLHGILSVAILAWVVYHGLLRIETAIRGGDPERSSEARSPLQRRIVLRDLVQSGGSAVAAVALVGWFNALQRSLRAAAEAGTGATPPAMGGAADTANAAPTPVNGQSQPLPGFQLYTVTGGIPSLAYTPAAWKMTVVGAVGQPLTLSLAELLQLPQTSETRNFYCTTGWVVNNITWTGVAMKDLLAAAQPTAAATWLSFDSFDGAYTDSLSMDQALAGGVMLAHTADGAPLAPEQGAPVRLLVPTMYGYKSVKWLSRIRLISARELGYWEQRGYGPDAYVGTVNGWPAGGGLDGLLP